MYEERQSDFIDPREHVINPCVELTPEQMKEKSRSRQNCLRDYTINIRFLSTGCVIEVGCKSIPFTSVDEAMKQLNAYIANPEAVSNEWLKILD
jgi:hypothetical protein